MARLDGASRRTPPRHRGRRGRGAGVVCRPRRSEVALLVLLAATTPAEFVASRPAGPRRARFMSRGLWRYRPRGKAEACRGGRVIRLGRAAGDLGQHPAGGERPATHPGPLRPAAAAGVARGGEGHEGLDADQPRRRVRGVDGRRPTRSRPGPATGSMVTRYARAHLPRHAAAPPRRPAPHRRRRSEATSCTGASAAGGRTAPPPRRPLHVEAGLARQDQRLPAVSRPRRGRRGRRPRCSPAPPPSASPWRAARPSAARWPGSRGSRRAPPRSSRPGRRPAPACGACRARGGWRPPPCHRRRSGGPAGGPRAARGPASTAPPAAACWR